MATWSISVSSMPESYVRSGVTPEEGDLRLESLAHRVVGDAEPLAGREHENADLALVEVVVDLGRGLADVFEHEDLGERGVHLPLADEAVRLPCLAVVREVASLERLEVHPEVAVVVLDGEAAR